MAQSKFSVIEFNEKNKDGTYASSVVPTKWIVENNECRWPPYHDQNKIDLAVKTAGDPDRKWGYAGFRRVLTETGVTRYVQ